MNYFRDNIGPDFARLSECILGTRKPDRVHFIELLMDEQIKEALCKEFEINHDLSKDDAFYECRREIALQRFLGYDYVAYFVENVPMPLKRNEADISGRSFIEEGRGPISNRSEFEQYPWPDPQKVAVPKLEWYQRNLPDDMCLMVINYGHFCEFLSWLMGYETLCYALHDDRELIQAMYQRILDIYRRLTEVLFEFDRIKLIFASDDMGYRGGTLISPDDLRSFVLSGHKMLAQKWHHRHIPYLLHSCGCIETVMNDLITDVGIDARHSFEDTIQDITTAKQLYGDKIAMLGGIDIDFLCNADEPAIRRRVRRTLELCMEGGRYCLGTGNSVASYIPLQNYLIMLDEGRRFSV